MSVGQPHHLILFDGVCGFCNRSVRWLIRRDHAAALRFAPLDGPLADSIRARHPQLTGVDSLVYVRLDSGGEHVYTHSQAVLNVCRELSGGWSYLRLLLHFPPSLLDIVYRLVARHRYKIWGRYDSCPVPEPGIKERFVE